MTEYSIKEMEHLTNVKAHTLRIWEKRYGIFQPKRTGTNIRYYSNCDLKLALNIAILNKYGGYRIGQIAKMSSCEIERHISALDSKKTKCQVQIKGLITAMMDLDEVYFDKILTASILKCGFEETMLVTIYPFLEKIGIMWLSGSINPAQEHFVTNLIRQKIIAAIDKQELRLTPASKTYLLFLPEGESHELSLLFLSYLLRVRQQKVLYLGSSMPLMDIMTTVEHTNPDFLYMIVTTSTLRLQKKYLSTLAQAFPDTTIIASGKGLAELTMSKVYANIKLMSTACEVLGFLDRQNKKV